MIRAVLVDDEKKSREVLRSLLQLYCQDVEIVAMAGTINEALAEIRQHHPDLLFLDISLKEGDSFMILDQLEVIDFEIVFITAYDEYSVKALNYSDIPCLFKPIDIDELVETVQEIKGRKELKSPEAYRFVNHLLKSKFLKIPILEKEGIRLLNQSEICCLRSHNEGTLIHMANGDEIQSKRDISKFQNILSASHFYPMEGSLLINLTQVDLPPERFRSHIVMKDGSKIQIPKDKVRSFWEKYKTIQA